MSFTKYNVFFSRIYSETNADSDAAVFPRHRFLLSPFPKYRREKSFLAYVALLNLRQKYCLAFLCWKSSIMLSYCLTMEKHRLPLDRKGFLSLKAFTNRALSLNTDALFFTTFSTFLKDMFV